MKTVLVTGATGYLGRQLTLRLAGLGYRVHALYRSKAKLVGLEYENITPLGGSLGDPQSIARAMEGCSQVYHVAACAATWNRDARVIYEQNVGGTETVCRIALEQGVERLVFTSTAGVLGPSTGLPNTEEKEFSGKHLTHYDRSKALAEKKVLEYCEKGLSAVILSPTRIYGPGYRSRSNALTMMLEQYMQGKWKYIPGKGKSVGNYVHVEDVVDCHLLAMEKGRSGERYLAGDQDLSFKELFAMFAKVTGFKRRMIYLPSWAMMAAAGGMMGLAVATSWVPGGGFIPPIVPAFVRRYNRDWEVSSDKARKELEYSPRGFEAGIRETMEWLKSRN